MPLTGDLPHPGIEAASLMSPELAGGFLTANATLEAKEPPSVWEAQRATS